MRANRCMLITVFSATLVFFLTWQTAIAGPPEKPGNQGVPGLLAEIAGLNAQIAELETIIEEYKEFAPVLKTGQTLCYDTVGDIIPCAGTGQDGEFQKGAARSYTDNGDGTITDNTTGLMWERLCDDDVNPLCPVINDVDPTYMWDEAYQKIADLNTNPCFANYCDWRLPNYNELQTLVHYGKQGLAIDSAFDNGVDSFTFGGPGSGTYLSSTSFKNDPSQKWVIGFVSGRNWLMENYLANVRAVRGPE